MEFNLDLTKKSSLQDATRKIQTKIKLLALDPGGSTGWALLSADQDKKIQVLEFGILKNDLTLEGIQHLFQVVDLVVCESFLTRPKDARKGAFDWDPMETSQVIGAVKALCRLSSVRYLEQNASIKPVGYGYIGRVYKKGKKGQHAWDAIAHGVYYLVRTSQGLPFSSGS